jgi:hypothetical protein
LNRRGEATGNLYGQPRMETMMLFILSKRAALLSLVMFSADIPQVPAKLEVKELFQEIAGGESFLGDLKFYGDFLLRSRW